MQQDNPTDAPQAQEAGDRPQDIDAVVQQIQEAMLAEARRQYTPMVIEHWLRPRNCHPMERPDGRARLTGPCRDTMELFIRVEGETITEASFVTDGCATSIASASMAVELCTGRALYEARLISGDDVLDALGGLPRGSEHCATLAANTLGAAIDDCITCRREPWKGIYGKR